MEPYFVKWMDTAESEMLLRHPPEMALLGLIARRARWAAAAPVDGLESGEAFLGDLGACGLTRRQYRTAQEHLSEWGLAEFRTVPSKGTVGRLKNGRVFDISGFTCNLTPHPPPPLVNDGKSGQHIGQHIGQQNVETSGQHSGQQNVDTTPGTASTNGDKPKKAASTPASRKKAPPASTPASTPASNKDKRKIRRREEERERAREFFVDLLREERFGVLDNPEFRVGFLEWLEYRGESRWPLTDKAIELNLGDAVKTGPTDALLRIRRAIKHGYRGWFFEDDVGTQKKNAAAFDDLEARRAAALT